MLNSDHHNTYNNNYTIMHETTFTDNKIYISIYLSQDMEQIMISQYIVLGKGPFLSVNERVSVNPCVQCM
jgi:hypothetical protein